MGFSSRSWLFLLLLVAVLFASRVHAFGAGNIASISAVEGKNFRHGDIEDFLKQVTCIKHHKWNTMMIKRVYFGNWLRDYSQAMDTGALKKAQPETIRILVWLLSFLGFGYATAEFEVTSERLGVYRPEEHIDNPKNYNDDEDARPYDPRLRGPVRPVELEVDSTTGMKNYIANGKGDWATSAAFVKYSFERSIHFGRLYTNATGYMSKGKDEDLAEACRLLGQGLHTLEDFGAHSNYIELAMIEMGFRDVFAHVGSNTAINLRGKRVFPLVTGTFGMVDFYHSVLGEATDHFTQSEVNEMDNAMGMAESAATSSNPLMTLIKLLSKVPGTKGLCDEAERLQETSYAQARRNRDRGGVAGASRGTDDFSRSRDLDEYGTTRAGPAGFPGAGHHGATSHDWNAQPHAQGSYNQQTTGGWDSYNQQPPPQSYQQPHQHGSQPYQPQSWDQPPQQSWQQPPASYHALGSTTDSQNFGNYSNDGQQQTQWQATSQHTTGSQAPVVKPGPGLEGMPDFDPSKTIQQIYPILAFRDKVVRSISAIIEKIPGLEAVVDRIVETLTVFILSLLAPFVRPVIKAISQSLQSGSEGVANANGKHQYEVWTDSNCSDPTHSMLSKDHFSNILNQPAGTVAGDILKYIAPRVLYAWEHPEVPVEKVLADVESIFHHPAVRDERNECHRNMFNTVRKWVDSQPGGGRGLEALLNAQAVRSGKNHKEGVNDHAGHGSAMGAGHNSGYGNLGGGAGTQQPGLGGYVHQAENVIGGLTGYGGSGQQHGGGGHYGGGGGGGSASQFGNVGGYVHQAENLIGGFSGGGSHGGKQSHYGGGGGGGGLGDMFSMASKLPGLGGYSSEINKLGSFLGGGGGRNRGIDNDGDDVGGRSRAVDDTGAGSRGYGDADLGDADRYRDLGLTSVGGAGELHDAARLADGGRTPSPGPLPPPSGYEQYSSGGYQPHGEPYGQSHRQSYNDEPAYTSQSQHHDERQQYGQQYHGQQSYGRGGGGESHDYYRG